MSGGSVSSFWKGKVNTNRCDYGPVTVVVLPETYPSKGLTMESSSRDSSMMVIHPKDRLLGVI